MTEQPEKYDDVVKEFEPLTQYEAGYVDGLREYAWWKDGRMQVGTTGTSLAQAVRRFFEHRENTGQRTDPDAPVLGYCPHGVDLDREFCEKGCRR